MNMIVKGKVFEIYQCQQFRNFLILEQTPRNNSFFPVNLEYTH